MQARRHSIVLVFVQAIIVRCTSCYEYSYEYVSCLPQAADKQRASAALLFVLDRYRSSTSSNTFKHALAAGFPE
eukprot:scaffold79006_cov15-Prasinocladus_malaysianus.AAC.1